MTTPNGTLPSVSVIVPFYNDAATIGYALESVVNQTVRAFEILVVDDGSRAEQKRDLDELLQRYQGHSVRVLNADANGGPSRARNLGWGESVGEYVAFLDADDVWHPEKLEVQLAVLQDRNDMSFLGAGLEILHSREFAWNPPVENARFTDVGPRHQVRRNRFVTSSVILRRGIQLRFDESMRYSEDNDLWVRLLLSGHHGAIMRDHLVAAFKAPFGQGGASSNMWRMLAGQLLVLRKLRNNGAIGRTTYLMAVASSLLRHCRRLIFSALRGGAK